ncbi:hypothetical protein M434DRAFT_394778 [Hypoxylon sp. CO27-5]|nr:hypothetical protein M434DRAFT_394778 [Hypoxylon sp. CO27-5]
MSRIERFIEVYEAARQQQNEAAPPPPYSFEPQKLKPWQIRWNREWLQHGLINDLRKSYVRLERFYRTGRGKEDIKRKRAGAEACVLDAIRNGATDKSNTLARSRWQRMKERFLGSWLDEYEAFKEWRKDRKEKDKVWKVTTVMEDTGDNPKWQAVMTFKITPEHWLDMENAGQWFDFPSTENIKWFWVTGPGYEHLCPPSLQHWGPVREFQNVTMPFYQSQDRVLRNPRPEDITGEYWPNFTQASSA